MILVDMHNPFKDLVSSNIQADSNPNWDKNKTYNIKDRVQYNGMVYVSLADGNVNKVPSDNLDIWYPLKRINNYAFADISPSSVSINDNDDINIAFRVTNVDFIYVVNVKGDKLTIDFAGQNTTVDLTDNPENVYDIWGLEDPAYASHNGFLNLGYGNSQNGDIIIKVTKSSTTNKSQIGYIIYGQQKKVGCTLIGEGVKYNVISGVKARGQRDLKRVKTDSFIEIRVPIKVDSAVKLSETISTLARYRGVPVLALVDDEAVREELIFFGLYTDIEASITEIDKYELVLSSLDTTAYTPLTDAEISEIVQEKKN